MVMVDQDRKLEREYGKKLFYIVSSASPFHSIYLSDIPDIQADQVPH